MPQVKRAMLRYFGSKWRVAPEIIKYFPDHVVYVEPFGGSAAVLLRKEPAWNEVYNDLDEDIVNLFRVLRTPAQAKELIRVVALTPFSRVEYMGAFEACDDPVERARRLLVRSWFSYSSRGIFSNSGYRSGLKTNKRFRNPQQEWALVEEALGQVVKRLKRVNIECLPAVEVIEKHDHKNTLFYVDPPYVAHTRRKNVYTFEFSDEDHRELAQCLHRLKGMVVLSGYASELYDKDLYADWQRVTYAARGEMNVARTEVLWINPAAQKALNRPVQMSLIEVSRD